jgi:hypothetical protein
MVVKFDFTLFSIHECQSKKTLKRSTKDILQESPESIAVGVICRSCKNIPIGYIESKDIGSDLNDKACKEQIDMFRQLLN